jgi:hypothetical protein
MAPVMAQVKAMRAELAVRPLFPVLSVIPDMVVFHSGPAAVRIG